MSGNIQVYGSRYKKSRRETNSSNGSVLNINDLPENVLIHIMSFLPMKDAMRTSVLSKEWEYKWASVYRINIDDKQRFVRRQTKKADFLSFVDRILLHCQDIQSFYLSCQYVSDRYRLKSWISIVSRRSVQSIDIFSLYCGGFPLPRCLFDSTSLTNLKLALPCIFKVPIKDYLCNLKFLFLSTVHFENEHLTDTERLILTFPVLESLELKLCTWGSVKFVEINSPSLTTFIYISIKALSNDFLIKVGGAKLEKFQIGGVLLDNFDLTASSVVDAAIIIGRCDHPFVEVSGSHSRLSIKEFSELKHLRLCGRIRKVYAQLKPGLSLPRFDRLEKLELSLCGSSETLLELLHMVPNLKLLSLELPFHKDHDFEDYNYDEVGSVPSCILSHITEIKFFEFWGSASQFDLVKFLLKNTVELEKVSVSVHRKPLIPMAKIEKLLSTYLKDSTCFSVVFT